MKRSNSQNYGLPRESIDEKSIESEKFGKIYDFRRLVKVGQHAERYERSNIPSDKKIRKKIRSPLNVGEIVLALAKRLRKKDAPGNLYKSATGNMPLFNHEQIFIVRKVCPQGHSHDYWISKTENGEIIKKRFLRQELFLLKD